MKEYKLKINDKDYTVVIKDVTDDAVLAEVNGKQHIVHVDTISSVAAQPKTPARKGGIASSSPAPVSIPDAVQVIPLPDEEQPIRDRRRGHTGALHLVRRQNLKLTPGLHHVYLPVLIGDVQPPVGGDRRS